jgi:hypothetical protein
MIHSTPDFQRPITKVLVALCALLKLNPVQVVSVDKTLSFAMVTHSRLAEAV